jgi:hypothetical protein
MVSGVMARKMVMWIVTRRDRRFLQGKGQWRSGKRRWRYESMGQLLWLMVMVWWW